MPRVQAATSPSDPLAEARRASLVLVLPILAGLTTPWAVWAAAGWIDANGLAVASMLLAAMYMHAVWWLGDREAALRARFGRRYTPPSADLALAVCMGLAGSMVAPGLSAAALVGVVGLPRASGLIDSYDPLALGASGTTIDLSRVIPGRGELDVVPGGVAHITVPRFGTPTAFALSWSAVEGAFCFAPSQCLTVDRRSGRVSVHHAEIGRITAVGAVPPPDSARDGAPWEIMNLFR
ncbi:MAG: hypothetical protein JOZ42_00995 [Acetobacteraceae bacterium]|nr:hypothetical protein [Acetobacteraceae bacterium]